MREQTPPDDPRGSQTPLVIALSDVAPEACSQLNADKGATTHRRDVARDP